MFKSVYIDHVRKVRCRPKVDRKGDYPSREVANAAIDHVRGRLLHRLDGEDGYVGEQAVDPGPLALVELVEQRMCQLVHDRVEQMCGLDGRSVASVHVCGNVRAFELLNRHEELVDARHPVSEVALDEGVDTNVGSQPLEASSRANGDRGMLFPEKFEGKQVRRDWSAAVHHNLDLCTSRWYRISTLLFCRMATACEVFATRPTRVTSSAHQMLRSRAHPS